MDSTPLGKFLNVDNVTSSKEKDEGFIKFRKESSSKKRDSLLHQARKEENPSKREGFEKASNCEKKEIVIKLEKTSTKRMRNKKEESARILIKLWEENNGLSKVTRDMRFHERSFKLRGMSKKMKIHPEKKFDQIKEDEEKKK